MDTRDRWRSGSLALGLLLFSTLAASDNTLPVGEDPGSKLICEGLRGLGKPGDFDADWKEGKGSVIGQVLWWDGSPQEGVAVLVQEDDRYDRGTLTDSLGFFRIDSIRPSSHVIRVEDVGSHSQDHHILIFPGTIEVICAVLTPEQGGLPPIVPTR